MQEFKLEKGCNSCIHELRNGCYSPEVRKMTTFEEEAFLESRDPCKFKEHELSKKEALAMWKAAGANDETPEKYDLPGDYDTDDQYQFWKSNKQ